MIRLITRSYVKWLGVRVHKIRYLAARFNADHTVVCVYKIIFLWNVNTWNISEVWIYKTWCLSWHVLLSLTTFSTKIRYNLVSSFIHYSTYWIDSTVVLLHKVKTFLRSFWPINTFMIVGISDQSRRLLLLAVDATPKYIFDCNVNGF